MLRFLAAIFSMCVLATAAKADVSADADLFGKLPQFSDVILSPDGNTLVLLQERGSESAIYVKDLDSGEFTLSRLVPNAYTLHAEFVDDRYLLVTNSFYRRRFQAGNDTIVPYSETLIYDLDKGKSYGFLLKNRTVHDHPFTARRIVGTSPNEGHVYATAWGSGASGGLSFNLYEVRLSNGRGKIVMRGDPDLRTKFLPSPDGQTVVQESRAYEKRIYQIDAWSNDNAHRLFESDVMGIEAVNSVGYDAAGKTLYYPLDRGNGSNGAFTVVSSTNIDGKIALDGQSNPTAFGRIGVDVDKILTDFSNVVHGVRYAGSKPEHEFFDIRVNEALEALELAFPDDAITVRSWSRDHEKLVVLIGGSSQAGTFYLYELASQKLTELADQYPGLPNERIGRVEVISYTARDGLEIPALLTHPTGTSATDTNADEQPLPLVVLPHGGPESHVELEYDYWAQFLANQGYMVLQPNFRGSDGFGRQFRLSGRGEWGRKMQDDITDGVNHLIQTGRADASRICIMGGSYGGYAALAGGAFTPELYKCVISFAGVADLEKMLKYEREEGGRSNNYSLAYWETVIGSRWNQDALFAASPARNADKFHAPVLLIHGAFDWIVPGDQSAIMERALKDANKDVEIYTLLGGDHYLSQEAHRQELLKMVGNFLDKHIGKTE